MVASRCGLCVALLLCSCALLAQKQKEHKPQPAPILPVLRVSLGDEVPTSLPNGALNRPFLCDERGSVYALIAGLDNPNPFKGPVYRVEPDGKTTAFGFNGIPETSGKDVGGFGFAVDPSGGVHRIVRTLEMKKGGIETLYIVSYWNDGSYRSRIELDKRYRPNHFVALSNGNFFLSGLLAKKDARSPEASESFTVLLNANGGLVRDLKRPSDDQPPTEEQKVKGFGKLSLIENPKIQTGGAWQASDGHLYLYRGGVPTRIQVFTPDGTPVRTLVLRSPSPEVQNDILGEASGYLWVTVFGPPELDEKGRRKSQTVKVVTYDAQTGEPVAEVDFSNVHAPVACVRNNELVLLKPSQTGKYAIVRGTVGR